MQADADPSWWPFDGRVCASRLPRRSPDCEISDRGRGSPPSPPCAPSSQTALHMCLSEDGCAPQAKFRVLPRAFGNRPPVSPPPRPFEPTPFQGCRRASIRLTNCRCPAGAGGGTNLIMPHAAPGLRGRASQRPSRAFSGPAPPRPPHSAVQDGLSPCPGKASFHSVVGGDFGRPTAAAGSAGLDKSLQ